MLEPDTYFGDSGYRIGELDGDEIQDIVIRAELYDGGGVRRGALWILFLNTNGKVKDHRFTL